MSEQHPRCPQCKGLLKYEPADILGPERVHCILCGWQKARASSGAKLQTEAPQNDSNNTSAPNMEITMTTTATATKRGFCPSCKRDDVLMPGPKCSRCYYRAKRGMDAITGEPIIPLRAHDFAVTPTPKLIPAAPAPKAPSEPKLAPAGYNIDLMAALDEAWQFKRASIIAQLQKAEKSSDRLSLACLYVSSIDCI